MLRSNFRLDLLGVFVLNVVFHELQEDASLVLYPNLLQYSTSLSFDQSLLLPRLKAMLEIVSVYSMHGQGYFDSIHFLGLGYFLPLADNSILLQAAQEVPGAYELLPLLSLHF